MLKQVATDKEGRVNDCVGKMKRDRDRAESAV